jgi:hypothetical protein
MNNRLTRGGYFIDFDTLSKINALSCYNDNKSYQVTEISTPPIIARNFRDIMKVPQNFRDIEISGGNFIIVADDQPFPSYTRIYESYE